MAEKDELGIQLDPNKATVVNVKLHDSGVLVPRAHGVDELGRPEQAMYEADFYLIAELPGGPKVIASAVLKFDRSKYFKHLLAHSARYYVPQLAAIDEEREQAQIIERPNNAAVRAVNGTKRG